MKFEKVYIQKMVDNAKPVETISDFDIYCADMPFKLFEEAKEPSKGTGTTSMARTSTFPPTGL